MNQIRGENDTPGSASIGSPGEVYGRRVLMPTALLTALVLMSFKFYGYWLTGSSAILSDALESIINVVAAGFSLASIILAAKPPDDSHPYGHGKIEFFAAGFEGALIILAAVGIFLEGIKQFLHPAPLPHLEGGLIILVVAGLANLVLGLTLLRGGKRLNSLVLQAHGKHVLTDVYSSVGVLGGLLLVYFTGWYRLDGLVACVVGANIVVMAFSLVRQSFGGLMDASDPALLEEICNLLRSHRKTVWIDAHRLRAWKAGQRVHVDFHLILPRDLPLDVGHREVKDLERIFSDHFGGNVEILVHLDPCQDPECPVCNHDPCDLRTEEPDRQREWERETLTEGLQGEPGRDETRP